MFEIVTKKKRRRKNKQGEADRNETGVLCFRLPKLEESRTFSIHLQNRKTNRCSKGNKEALENLSVPSS